MIHHLDNSMSLSFYHLLHLLGLILVFIGFGALFTPDSRRAMKWHGIGLLISLISGFGMLAKLGIFKSMPTWVWAKIGLWLVLGFLPYSLAVAFSPHGWSFSWRRPSGSF